MGKVGIFAPFSLGDLTISTCLLKHKDILWPSMDVIWFSVPAGRDILKFNPDISEIRDHASHHYGVDVRILGSSGKLSDNKGKYKDTADLDLGFYTTPWGNPKILAERRDIPYAFFPKFVIGKNMTEWKPCVYFSQEEEEKANAFVKQLPYENSIMIEAEARSGQSLWDESCTYEAIKICRKILGKCNFIFASPGSHVKYVEDGVVDCSSFTARQCIPVYNMCHMFIGVSSGISCLTTAWSAKEGIPRIEYCHESRMSTTHLSKCSLCTDKDALFRSIENNAKKLIVSD